MQPFSLFIFSLIPVALCTLYLKNNKNRNINLKNKPNGAMIIIDCSEKNSNSNLRGKVIDELSRQRLVFAPEKHHWVRRRQID